MILSLLSQQSCIASRKKSTNLPCWTVGWPWYLAALCPNGVISVVLWSDVNLDQLKVSIEKEGMRVWGNKTIPHIPSASDLFPQYPAWKHNREHIVIAHMQKTLDKVNDLIKRDVPEMKDRVPLITFTEAVLPEFVKYDGTPGGEIKHQRSNDGRMVISFFVKTLSSVRDMDGSFADDDAQVEEDPVSQMKEMMENTIRLQNEELTRRQQQREADARAHEEEMQRMQEEANRRHHEAMNLQQQSLEQQMNAQMAAMQKQFEQMMMAAATAATQQQGAPHPQPDGHWMPPVDISDNQPPVPDGMGS